jgi:hypothetical protein
VAYRRARTPSRRQAPSLSSSLVFATLIVLGAGIGLALVWRQAWMPSRPPVTASLPAAPEQRPSDAAPTPAPPDTAAPAESTAAAPPPAAAADGVTHSAVAPPAPAPATPAAPAPVTTRAPEPTTEPPAAPPVKKAPEPAASKVVRRSDAPARAAERSPSLDPPSKETAPAPRLFNARTTPGSTVPPPGARVISLVPVGPAQAARGQLFWEPFGGGMLVVSGLPQPPLGRTYQLWLGSIDLGNRISAGLLVVDAQGAGTLRVAPPRATWSPDIFGVTVERQGGAREPSDDLVLVGELPKTTTALGPSGGAAPADATGAKSTGTEPLASSEPVTTAALPPPATPSRGPDGQLVRVVPVPMERTWLVTQSALRSLGWGIDRADQATGIIQTEPRNVSFKDFIVYADGVRHTVAIVVRPVSGTETSISVKREVYQEQRIFWTKERKVVATPESSVEQTILNAIERLL